MNGVDRHPEPENTPITANLISRVMWLTELGLLVSLASSRGGLMGVHAMTKHSHPTQLLDRAEIDRAVNRAKALRAEMFRTSFRAFVDFVRALPGDGFSSVTTLRSSSEWTESSHINAS